MAKQASDAQGLAVRASTASPVWYHGTRGTLLLDDCRIAAADEIVGYCSEQTPAAVLQRSAINLGLARAAYEAALAHAQLKVQGARRIV
jgi:alkylation response protein AidB-like acyl-CoA dehydrogenase